LRRKRTCCEATSANCESIRLVTDMPVPALRENWEPAAWGLRETGQVGTTQRAYAMEITEIRVSLRDDEKLKAFISITLDGCFVVRGLKVIKGNKGLFVAMPSRKKPDGTYQDLCHPINMETREWMEREILARYEAEVERSLVG
jgi:stage V sporulation protein G